MPNPVSTDLRRDLGIWAGVLAVAHFLVGWQVHMKHRYLYWLREVEGSNALRPRTDLFGFANYTGLAAVLIAVLLLALSNDYFLRTLGTARRKRLQGWNYPFYGLVLLHGIAFQLIEKRKGAFVITMSILVIAASVFQVLGYTRRRASRGMPATPLGNLVTKQGSWSSSL
jgi:sulfoxide reductase heme-binding subunit YedZ